MLSEESNRMSNQTPSQDSPSNDDEFDALFNELDARYSQNPVETDEMIEEWSSILEIPPDVLQVEQIWDAERKKAYLAENKHTSFLKNFGEEDG